MKTNIVLFSVFALFGAVSAMASRPIECKSADGRYELGVSTGDVTKGETEGAILLIDGVQPKFGELRCIDLFSPFTRLDCRSRGVVDAGYHAFVDGATRKAQLSEVSFAGDRPLAVLSCEF
jgi:hypothetical protein